MRSKSIVLKFILLVFSLFIIYFVIVFSNIFVVQFKPEKHYLQKGFIGEVNIFYGNKNGENKVINGYRIFEIPKNGICYSKFSKCNHGWIEKNTLRFYMVDTEDTIQIKNWLDIITSDEKLDSNDIVVINYSSPIKGEFNVSQRLTEYNVDTFKNLKNVIGSSNYELRLKK